MPNPTWLYVAIVYAIAVWIARRARVDVPWRIAVGFYLLVLLFLFRPMTQAYVSFPTDVVRMIPPWSNVLPPGRPPITKYEVSNLNTHDVTMQLVPWAHQVRQAWRSLRVPLWNAEAGCGYPLLANGQSSALSPLRLIALPLPLGYAMTAEAAMKLLIALTFMYLFCRRRYSEAASIAGAIAFGFCTFLNSWLHFAHVTAAVFLPAVLLAIDLLAGGFTRARFAFAAIVFALTVVAGHPETAIHIALMAIPFAVWVVFVDEAPAGAPAPHRRIAGIIGAGILAMFLAAPFLLPFMEALHRSQRYQELKVTPNRVTPYSDFASATLLLLPSLTGHLPEERPWGPTTIESVSGFAGVFGIVAWVALAVQVVVRRRWRDRELLYTFLTIIILGAILNWSVVSVPLHAALGMVAHARLRFLLCALLSIQAAAAIDARRRDSGVFLLIGAAVVSAMLLSVMRTLGFPGSGARDTAVLWLLPSLCVLLAAMFLAVRGSVVAVIATTVIELFVIDAGWNPSLPLRTSYPRTPLITALERLRDAEVKNGPFRISGLGSALYPNTNVMFGFEDARVHDPMANGAYLGFLRELTPYDPSDYYAKWNDPDTPVLDLVNVRYLVTDRGVDLRDRSRYEVVYDGTDGRIYRNRNVLPRFFGVGRVVTAPSVEALVEELRRVTDFRNTAVTRWGAGALAGASVSMEAAERDRYRLRVRAGHPALVVSSIALYPGWRIRSGGRSLHAVAVNGPFLGFVVPAGESEVTLEYAPTSFRVGLFLATVGALVLAGLLFRQLTAHRAPRSS